MNKIFKIHKNKTTILHIYLHISFWDNFKLYAEPWYFSKAKYALEHTEFSSFPTSSKQPILSGPKAIIYIVRMFFSNKSIQNNCKILVSGWLYQKKNHNRTYSHPLSKIHTLIGIETLWNTPVNIHSIHWFSFFPLQ